MDNYQTRHIAELFDISSATVRKYANKFQQYMSIEADREDGQHRVYNDDDLKVFATVVILRNQDKSWDEIDAILAQGDRFEPPEFDDDSLAIASSSVGNQIMQRFETIEERLQELEDSQNEVLKAENAELKKEIRDLYRQLGKLEGKYGVDDETEK